MEKTPDNWTVATRLWLIRNYVVSAYSLVGGAVTVFFAYRWAIFLSLSPFAKYMVVATCAVISMLLVILLDYFRQPRVRGTLTPVAMNSTDARLTFKNSGKKADFFVKCEFTGQVNIPNPLPSIVYDLAWENQTTKVLSLAEGDSAHLMLATWRWLDTTDTIYSKDVKRKMGIAEFKAVGKDEPEHLMLWHYDLKDLLPACDVKVTVRSDGGKGTIEGFFTVEPQRFHGPLQVSHYQRWQEGAFMTDKPITGDWNNFKEFVRKVVTV